MSYSASAGSPGHGSSAHNSLEDDDYLGEPHPYEHPDDGYSDEDGGPHRHPGRKGRLINSRDEKIPPNRRHGRSADMASTRRRPRGRDDDRRRAGSLPPRTSRRSVGGGGGLLDCVGLHGLVGDRWAGGVEAAVGAAAVEMFRTRKEPGSLSWKAARVATAALTAAAIETTVDKRVAVGGSSNKLVVAESAVAGLLVNRVVNGSRKDPRF